MGTRFKSNTSEQFPVVEWTSWKKKRFQVVTLDTFLTPDILQAEQWNPPRWIIDLQASLNSFTKVTPNRWKSNFQDDLVSWRKFNIQSEFIESAVILHLNDNSLSSQDRNRCRQSKPGSILVHPRVAANNSSSHVTNGTPEPWTKTSNWRRETQTAAFHRQPPSLRTSRCSARAEERARGKTSPQEWR